MPTARSALSQTALWYQTAGASQHARGQTMNRSGSPANPSTCEVRRMKVSADSCICTRKLITTAAIITTQHCIYCAAPQDPPPTASQSTQNSAAHCATKHKIQLTCSSAMSATMECIWAAWACPHSDKRVCCCSPHTSAQPVS